LNIVQCEHDDGAQHFCNVLGLFARLNRQQDF
jgi:hypothetical protein